MKCVRCGRVIDDKRLLCNACAKTPQLFTSGGCAPLPRPSAYSVLDWLGCSPVVKAIIALIVLGTLGGYAAANYLNARDLHFTTTHDTIAVSDGHARTRILYELREPLSVQGRVLRYTPHSRTIDEVGVSLEVRYLSEEDYAVYSELRGKSAPFGKFLNEKARVLYVVVEDRNFFHKAAALSVKEGDSITLQGRALRLREAFVNGVPTTVSGGESGFLLLARMTRGEEVLSYGLR